MKKKMTAMIAAVCASVCAFANMAISPQSQSFDWQGGDAAIATSGTGGWSAYKDNSWITISPRTSGSCGESCIYTISANNTVTNRNGSITIDYLPQHSTNDVAWGLTWWQGSSFNSTNRWNDSSMVNDVLATGTSYRDAGLPGEPTVSTYWGRTESVWFKVTELNLLNRLFDLDNGKGSIYINTLNKITLQYGDEVVVTDYTVSQGGVYELLIISGASDGTYFTPGTTAHLNEIYIGRRGGTSFTNIYSQRSSRMMLVSDYGHTTLPSANYITRGETSQGAYSYWNRVLSAEEIQNHNSYTIAPDNKNYSVYSSLRYYCSCEKGIIRDISRNANFYDRKNKGISYRDRYGLPAGALGGDIEIRTRNDLVYWADAYMASGHNILLYRFDEIDIDSSPYGLMQQGGYGIVDHVVAKDTNECIKKCTINIWLKETAQCIDSVILGIGRVSENSNAFPTAYRMQTESTYEYTEYAYYYTVKPLRVRMTTQGIFVDDYKSTYGPFSIPEASQWKMLTLGITEDLLTIYVDGSDIGNCRIDATRPFMIPSLWYISGDNGKVIIDEVEVFESRLTSAQIRNLYALEYQQPLVHTITQSGREATLSATSCKVSSEASNISVKVTLPSSSTWWSIKNLPAWLSVNNATNNLSGTKTITLSATENNSVYARTATILIAEQEFTFEQDGVAVELDCSAVGVDQTGGRRSITVRPERSVSWTAVSDVPWITIMSGDSGTGNGNVSFYVDSYSANFTRTGTLTIAGQSVTILQRGFSDLSLMPSSIEVDGGATNVTIQVSKTSGASIAAVSYAPWISIGTVSAGYNICTVNCRIAKNSKKAARVGYINISGTLFAISQRRMVSNIEYTNLKGGYHDNSSQYAEGDTVTFTPAYGVIGYTFAGWTPSQITAEMTGMQTVSAAWTANSYSITYNSNGGDGAMDATAATYDAEAIVATNCFTWTGYVFAGWATNEVGEVIYAAGQPVTNLTGQAGGIVTLYAVWEPLVVSSPEVSIDGVGTISASASFSGDSCAVTIQCATEGATIYFSTNGVAPRISTAYVYTEPFTITSTATIKAIAALDGTRSNPISVTVTKVDPVPPATPVVSPADGSSFIGDSCEVSISCATPDATIYYSTNGVAPRTSAANAYVEPFTITGTTIIMAVAVKDGVRSTSVTATITQRTLSLAEAVGAPSLAFTTGGDSVWTPIADNASLSGYSARSGEIDDAVPGGSNLTWLATTVTGAGTFGFDWKVACEHDYMGGCTWDRLMVFTNDIETARIDGVTGWESKSLVFDDSGTHTVRWVFLKDDANDEMFEDCAWVSGVTWTPSSPADVVVSINGTNVTVSGTWLSENTTRAATDVAANGNRSVAECYLLGVDPEDPDDDFKITRFWMDGGKPMFEFSHTRDGSGVSFEPRIRKLGKAALGDAWQVVPSGGNPAFRFFTVEVALP